MPEPCPLISHLIQRRDLLDDNNAGKEAMTEAKKKLKVSIVLLGSDLRAHCQILLRPGESEKRPDLAWPKSFKKEPVEVVTVSLDIFIATMRVGRRADINRRRSLNSSRNFAPS